MAEFEYAWKKCCALSSITSARIASIACTITFAVFSLLDYSFFASPASFVLQISICIFMLGAFVITFNTKFYVRVHSILVSSCVVVFVGGLLGLNVIRHEGYTFRELITIVIIPHTLHYYLRLNFIYAASTCFISQVCYSVLMPLCYGFHNEFITLNIFMFASSLIAVFTNYGLERRNKMEYIRSYDLSQRVKDSVQEEEIYRSKGLLLANMAQELTIPIRVICGRVQLYNTPFHETQHHIKAVRDCSQVLLSLTDNIVQMAKMDEETHLEEHLINLCDIVEQAVRVIAEPASIKRLKMSSYVSSQIPDCVVGDAPKVLQILVNLLGNAVKFTSQGCVHIMLTLNLETESAYSISIQVKDTGAGIAVDDIPYLCKWFRQSANSIPQGSAVGLILVNQFANLMGGELDVSSTPGGSTFRVSLNFAKYYPPNHIVPSSSSHVPWSKSDGITPLRVLLVDSSEDSRTAVCAYLREASPRLCVDTSSHLREVIEFCVVPVSNPDTAIQALLQYRFSVVIVNDWIDYSFSQLFLELDSNPTLTKTQLIYACQERSPYVSKFQALLSRSALVRLPLRRESLLKTLFRAADASLFGSLDFPDEASRQMLTRENSRSDNTTINMDLVEFYMNCKQIERASNNQVAVLHLNGNASKEYQDVTKACAHPDTAFLHHDDSSTFSSGLVGESYSPQFSATSYRDNYLNGSSDFSSTSNICASDGGSCGLKSLNIASLKDHSLNSSNTNDPLPLSPPSTHYEDEQVNNSV